MVTLIVIRILCFNHAPASGDVLRLITLSMMLPADRERLLWSQIGRCHAQLVKLYLLLQYNFVITP